MRSELDLESREELLEIKRCALNLIETPFTVIGYNWQFNHAKKELKKALKIK